MNALKIQRYYEVKKFIRELEAEAKMLNDEIKEEMLEKNMKEAVIGKYQLQLQRQDRSEIRDTVVPYLKASGYGDIVIETYDRERFREFEKRGLFDEQELKRHRVERIVYALFVKTY